MIFSSAHTDTQDRMVSSTTSITHFCPSWHNIVDIQVKCLSLTLGSGFHCAAAAAEILSRSLMSVCASLDKSAVHGSLTGLMRVPVTPEAVSSHTEWLAYTFKLRQSRTEQRDTHNIYKCVVGGMLRVRLLCKVRKFSPITRSRGDRSPSFSKQKSQYYTPGFIRGL